MIDIENPPVSTRVHPDSSAPSRRAPLRVVLFDHTAQLGGGEIALYDLVRFLNRSLVTPVVVLGADGPLAEKLRGLSATATPVELYILPLADEVLHAKKDALGTGTLLQFRKVTSSIAYIFRLRAFLLQHKADLIHTNSLKADILGGLAGRLAGVPVLWHIRDRIEPDYLPAKVVWLMRKLARILPRYVVANSTATLATVHLEGKVPGGTVSSGVDMTKFEVPAGTQTAQPAVDPANPMIGIVGRLCPWKGQHIFLEAAAIVRRQWPGARFQIIGAALFQEKHLEEDLQAQAAGLGLIDVVEFTGFRSDVNLLIQQLTILVHASTTGEPFGQVIVQGMAASKPVVATDGGGVPEIVVDGVTGYLVPMSDPAAMAAAISTLLSAPAQAAEMGRRGRERILEKFTIQSSARTLEGVYAAVMNPAHR